MKPTFKNIRQRSSHWWDSRDDIFYVADVKQGCIFFSNETSSGSLIFYAPDMFIEDFDYEFLGWL